MSIFFDKSHFKEGNFFAGNPVERCFFSIMFSVSESYKEVFQNSTSLGVFIDFLGEKIVYVSPSLHRLPRS